VNEFQIGDRVKLVETDREGVIIGRCYGDERYDVRCDNGIYVRDLSPEALRLIESPAGRAFDRSHDEPPCALLHGSKVPAKFTQFVALPRALKRVVAPIQGSTGSMSCRQRY